MCKKTVTTIIEKAKEVFGHPAVEKSGVERASPKGRVDQVIRYQENGQWWIKFGPFPLKPRVTGVANTNSMEPLIDDPFTSVLIKVDPADIAVGDVCTYLSGFGEVIHAVVEILRNNLGRWFRMKGYNNKGADSQEVRDAHIKEALVAEIFTRKKVTLP